MASPPSPATARASRRPAGAVARRGAPRGGHAVGGAARYRRRLTTALAAAEAVGATHLLVSNPKDVGYLTGFHGGDSYLMLGPGGSGGRAGPRAVIISDFRYAEELDRLRGWVDPFIRSGAMSKGVGDQARALGVKRLGVQAEHMTLATRAAVEAELGRGVKLVQTSGLVLAQRLIKDAEEIASIRAAVKIQEAALEAMLDEVAATLRKKGSVDERSIAAVLEFEMKSRGSSEPSFETIIAAGANGSLPHYRPGDARLSRGGVLLVDWGAMVGGYHSDMTRTVCFGKWPAKIREIYSICLEAHAASASLLRAGRSNREVDRAARDIIARAGYGDRFGHGLGHGIGLDIHEGPRLSQAADEAPLRAGQVVTIEPGIYLPGIGGVRLENDYLVTKSGSECLASLPMDLGWATRR